MRGLARRRSTGSGGASLLAGVAATIATAELIVTSTCDGDRNRSAWPIDSCLR